MNQEVIQDFLNLPGIVGVALMDGRSRPYFCGIDQTLNFQQKEALAQGVLRVIETIPDGFETFEFWFTEHQVYIYKLEHGVVLLVLTRDGLINADYLKTIKDLKVVLNEDITNAIATFRYIAGNITLPGRIESQGITTGSTPAPSTQVPPTVHSESISLSPSNTITNPSASISQQTASDAIAQTNSATLKETIAALNTLSKFTTEYLGTHVIVNYWKATRPSHIWLNQFQIERSAQFSFSGSDSASTQLTLEQQKQVQEWVVAFMQRCSQVIRDFPTLVEQKAVSEPQKRLLLG